MIHPALGLRFDAAPRAGFFCRPIGGRLKHNSPTGRRWIMKTLKMTDGNFLLKFGDGERRRFIDAISRYQRRPSCALRSVARRAQWVWDYLHVADYNEDARPWERFEMTLPEKYFRLLHIALELDAGTRDDYALLGEFWRPWVHDDRQEYDASADDSYTFLPPLGVD